MKAARLRSGCDMAAETVTMKLDALEELCVAAALRCGADADAAHAVARASIDAEASGQKTVGLAHFLDYLDSWRAGRIKAGARPVLTRPLPAIIHSDAGGGVAYCGFDTAFEELIETARSAISRHDWPRAACLRLPPPTALPCWRDREPPDRHSAPIRWPLQHRAAMIARRF
jgi:hypothetical protein